MSSIIAQPDRLIRDVEVAAIYGVTRQCIWRWADKNRIPKPVVQRTKFARWSQQQIQADIEALKNAERAEAAS